MKLRMIFAVLLVGFGSSSLLARSALNESSATRSKITESKNTQLFSGFSVMLYLPLVDDAYSSIMAQAQMTVTPTATYSVRAIKITGWNSTNGSCTSLFGTYNIDNGAGNTVQLTNGHAYTSTDASNRALITASGSPNNVFSINFDDTLQLLDNDLNPIGASVCIPAGGVCTDATNCGWTTPRTWTP